MGRLIDADALMPKLKFIRKAEHQVYGKESWGFASKCITAIEDAPTIEERKTGRWIKTINNNYSPFDNSGEYIGICSECGYKVDLGDGGIYSFCSACGAPMTEGEQDETD